MISFDKTKLGTVLALIAIMFAIHPVVTKFETLGFDMFGFSLTVDRVYVFFVLILLCASYFYALSFITEKTFPISLQVGNIFYATALIIPPAYFLLFVCKVVAEFVGFNITLTKTLVLQLGIGGGWAFVLRRWFTVLHDF